MTPRTLREALFPATLDRDREPGWMAIIGWTCVGAIAMWAYLALVLGWPA